LEEVFTDPPSADPLGALSDADIRLMDYSDGLTRNPLLHDDSGSGG
jgi:hypothetical protein